MTEDKPPRGRLTQAFRKLGSFAMTAAMMLSLMPRTSRAATPPPQNRDAAITAIKTEFGRTKMGADMLRLARDQHIGFEFDDRLAAEATSGAYDNVLGKVKYSPTIRGEEEVIFTAHELRHMWQDKILKFAEMEGLHITPEQRFALRRYIEADARAFSAWFEADRMRELGKTPANCGTAEEECKMAAKLYAEFSSPDGLTSAEYRKIALEPSFGMLGSYNERHLTFIGEMVAELGKAIEAAQQSPVYMQELKAALRKLPDDAAFETYLRRFGGTSLDAKVPTSLQGDDVSASTLYKYPRITHDLSARVTELPPLNRALNKLSDDYDQQLVKLDQAQRLKP